MLGSHVTTIAYPLLVLHVTGSPFTAGCAVFAATAPSMFAYAPAGALVDRWNPRRVMLLSELGRGVAIGAVAATLAFGNPMVALLMAVAVIEGILEVFSSLAERRYVRSIVERDQISSALVRTEAKVHVALVAGRPLGGLLFGIGPIFPFLTDFSSFIYSVAILFRMKDSKPTREAAISPRVPISKNSLIDDIGQGLRWIHKNRLARMAIISFSFGTLSFQALIMIFLCNAHSTQLPAFSIGVVLAASGVGGAVGSLVASRLHPKIIYWMPIQTGVWLTGFSFFLFHFGREISHTAIIMAILGFTGALGNIALDTHVMQNADQEMLARVTSVGQSATFTACSIGPVIGGILVREFGNQIAMSYLWLFTLVPLALSIYTVFTPQWEAHHPDDERDMELPDPAVSDGTGAGEAEPVSDYLHGGTRNLLPGATIAALVMIMQVGINNEDRCDTPHPGDGTGLGGRVRKSRLLVEPGDELNAGGDAQLGVDAGDVRVDGAAGDDEPPGDLAIGEALAD
jgi:MFS family permease